MQSNAFSLLLLSFHDPESFFTNLNYLLKFTGVRMKQSASARGKHPHETAFFVSRRPGPVRATPSRFGGNRLTCTRLSITLALPIRSCVQFQATDLPLMYWVFCPASIFLASMHETTTIQLRFTYKTADKKCQLKIVGLSDWRTWAHV